MNCEDKSPPDRSAETPDVLPDDLDQLLDGLAADPDSDLAPLAAAIYPDLRRIAASRLAAWSGEISLEATELAHEVVFKLLGQHRASWQNRQQLFAVIARLLRRVLVDQARRRSRLKRGGAQKPITLHPSMLATSDRPLEVLALDRALDELAKIDELACRVVEVVFFSGLTHDEAAAALGIGRATVGRKWRFARSWLHRRLAP